VNSRERFRATMASEPVDHAPYFEEGLRQEVLDAWRAAGHDPEAELGRLMPVDRRDEIQPDLDPRPAPERWPTSISELEDFRHRLDPDDPARLPEDWERQVGAWRGRDHVVMLRAHRGFFLSTGVHGWDRLWEVICLTQDDPAFVHRLLELQAELATTMAERILDEVEVDAVVVSEPIGGNDRPLLSPAMYADFVLSSYAPLLELLRRRGVETVILRTYANARVLLPTLVEHGFNCLWACEAAVDAMDYRDIRRQHGRGLGLIGGIDLDLLRGPRDRIRPTLEATVPRLLADGAYVPLADGRVREDVPFASYLEYRRVLEEILRLTGQADGVP
jgi:uroporphyrinogen decarboxylase